MSLNKLVPEWGRQDAIVIVWPHAQSDWADCLNSIETFYTTLCCHICQHQELIIVAYNELHKLHIQQLLSNTQTNSRNISYAKVPTNDTWIRDYGPVCIQTGNNHTILNFKFDAWGHKYPHILDNAFNNTFTQQFKLNATIQNIDLVLEAGNLEINNRGDLFCSSKSITRKYIENTQQYLTSLEEQFSDWFGCNKTYWIHDVQLAGDDTDGHIDTLVRFCCDDIIAYTSCNNPSDINYKALENLTTQLKSIKKQSNNNFELVPLPLPQPKFLSNNQLPVCYTNFLITNKKVLVPMFKDKQDDYVLKLLDEIFQYREIIGIDSNALIQQFGGIHCATMQIPQGVLQ